MSLIGYHVNIIKWSPFSGLRALEKAEKALSEPLQPFLSTKMAERALENKLRLIKDPTVANSLFYQQQNVHREK